MPNDADDLAARLTRIKYLIDALDAVSSHSQEQLDLFVKVKHEIETARAALRATAPSP